MILYDKNSVFLGMSNQELYFLGYEDMEEFRNYCNDLADLFVNKPGYIFKFQNFSWIDYTLHSGTPNKKVLIKTKHGKEIETSLIITEVFLTKEVNSTSKLFCIELSNLASKQDKSATTMDSTFPSNQNIENRPTSANSVSGDEVSFVQAVDFSGDSTLYEAEDYTPYEEPIQAPLNTIPAFNESPSDISVGLKLKFDNDILTSAPSSHLEYSSIDEIKVDDLNFNASEESYPEDGNEDLQNDPNLSIKPVQKNEEEAFDFAFLAEELGLDISLIALIVTEYADEIDSKMPLIAQYLENNDLDLAQQEIEKLKSVALNLHITSLFYQFEHLEKSLRYDTKQELTHSLNNVYQAIATFKKNLC